MFITYVIRHIPLRSNICSLLYPSTTTFCSQNGYFYTGSSSFKRYWICSFYCINRVNYISGFHSSARRRALTQFNMPAMSPTMTEGGIASWKKKEGETFSTGDVLLEIVSCQVISVYPLRNPVHLRKLIRPQSTLKLRMTGSLRKSLCVLYAFSFDLFSHIVLGK